VSVAALQELLAERTGVPAAEQELLTGFPPAVRHRCLLSAPAVSQCRCRRAHPCRAGMHSVARLVRACARSRAPCARGEQVLRLPADRGAAAAALPLASGDTLVVRRAAPGANPAESPAHERVAPAPPVAARRTVPGGGPAGDPSREATAPAAPAAAPEAPTVVPAPPAAPRAQAAPASACADGGGAGQGRGPAGGAPEATGASSAVRWPAVDALPCFS
jgi:hypothetical protein